MSENQNELTIENCAVVLIDHQPAVALMTTPRSQTELISNVTALAKAAKILDVPTVLTTVGATGGPLVDPIFKELSEVFPDVEPIDRVSTNSWSDPRLRAAVEATGRRKLVMAGLSTDVCLAQAVLGALKSGYEVYFVTDCSAGVSPEAHEDAKTRLSMAGARPVNWAAVVSEWTPDYTSPERVAVTDVLARHGGTAAHYTDFFVAQVSAGVVKTPDFLK
ncbi:MULTISPECIES: isochorismatase family protein [Streptomyces]|uniref:isochorismatase family protein n=1 Tax=Streptomyces TaxID=1883 RepID=UPI00025CB887|nr:isochorismatase family protein [Streptomyces tsukubensis]EIF94041.1 isochorismatase hydrolase [Streptomyces tsukubensis NRRL18488]MYS66860.1 isochorismatase family protein [Streptomyces sp. SID5473]